MNDEFQNLFLNKKYLESIYMMLKGDDSELKRETIKNYIEEIEGVEYEDKESDNETINFEEFCQMFEKIHQNSQNPSQIFVEGFAFLDQER